MTDTTTDLATRAAPPADWWRNPSRLTPAEKKRLGRLSDREAEALDVTSDEHEYVWGFRQDRPDERHRLDLAELAGSHERWQARTAEAGHAMTWDMEDPGPGFAATWHGRCENCGATMSISPGGTSIGRGAWCARDMTCKGPGTAWQERLVHELQARRMGEAVAQFGQDVKEQHDKAWLREQGIGEG